MSDDGRCQGTREAMPELALGIADGEERARALEHVAACSDCRRELDRLSAIGDELLELAPEQEPPPGFELRVLASLEPPREKPQRTPRRALVLVAAALAASALTAGGLLLSFRDDRQLAAHYRAVLAEAHGSYFGAFRLQDAAGTEGGVAFIYRGSPSWLMITVTPAYRGSVARAEVVGADGRRVPLEWFRLREGSWGGAVPPDVGAISSVHLLAKDGHPLLVADPSRSR
jgi:hypothetical protein